MSPEDKHFLIFMAAWAVVIFVGVLRELWRK